MRDVLTISALNNYIKSRFESDTFLNYVEVRGEIINLKRYQSAVYFTLKEGDIARLSAVTFNIKSFPSTLKDGDEVIVRGRVSVYPKSGTYQIICHDVNYFGLGAKLVALAELKVKLEKTGIFDRSRKKPLPRFPKTIGIITPKDSAAQSDLITNIGRRYPLVSLKICHATFQGESAPSSLISAFKRLNDEAIDILIIARGGGSSDDLWAFNDEDLIVTLSTRKVPLISAIGHEIDTTLLDYLADVRASTPTAAAELSVPDENELKIDITNAEMRLINAFSQKYDVLSTKLENLISRPVLNDFNVIMSKLATSLSELKVKMASLISRSLHEETLKLSLLSERFNKGLRSDLTAKSERLTYLDAKLMALNPSNVLSRGYAFISRGDDIIKSAHTLKKGDDIKIQFSDGTVNAVTKGEEDE